MPAPEIKLELPIENAMINNNDGSHTIRPYKNPQALTVGSREENGTINNEMQYSYVDFNSMPVSYDNTTSPTMKSDGYSFLPPAMWYPTPPHPPVCVTEQKCPVCPVYTNGTVLELKEWDNSRRISPPDDINVRAVMEKLNSGR